MSAHTSSRRAAALRCLLFLAVMPAAAAAQATPARVGGNAAGFQLPSTSGTLTYSLTASDGVQLEGNGTGAGGSTNSFDLSGNLAFLSSSRTQPFSLVYSGGYLFGQSSSLVQNLALSQVFKYHRFSAVLSDGVSYLPFNPVAGLSGVPGLGDVGVGTIGGSTGESSAILSNNGARLTNFAAGSLSYSLTPRTSVGGSGSYSMLRVPGGTDGVTGLQSNTQSDSGNISHRLSARTTISAVGYFSHFTYLDLPIEFSSEGISGDISRQWTAHLSTEFSAGPQRTATTGEPNNFNYQLSASANYQLRRTGLTASFVRSTSSGSGVTAATRANSANVSANRRLGEYTRVSGFVSYSRSTPLPSELVLQVQTPFDTVVTGGQISRTVASNLSAFASYTLEHQIVGSNDLAINALSGTEQTLAFGLTYSPRPHVFGR